MTTITNTTNTHEKKARRIATLLVKYMRDDLTPTEHDELDEWVGASDKNMRLFEELTDETKIKLALDLLNDNGRQLSKEMASNPEFIYPNTPNKTLLGKFINYIRTLFNNRKQKQIMKKSLLGLVLALTISTITYAHHFTALGWCSLQGGQAMFTTASFGNNLEVQVRFYNTTTVVTSFTTAATGSTAYIFKIPQPVQSNTVRIQFRYRIAGSSGNSGWSLWGDGEFDSNDYVISKTTAYSGCGFLPVKFQDIAVSLIYKPRDIKE